MVLCSVPLSPFAFQASGILNPGISGECGGIVAVKIWEFWGNSSNAKVGTIFTVADCPLHECLVMFVSSNASFSHALNPIVCHSRAIVIVATTCGSMGRQVALHE